MAERMMTIAEAAEAVGVTVDTLRTWVNTGRVEGSVFTTRHGRLIPSPEVERLIGERAATAAKGETDGAPLLPPKRPPVYSPPAWSEPSTEGIAHDRRGRPRAPRRGRAPSVVEGRIGGTLGAPRDGGSPYAMDISHPCSRWCGPWIVKL
jgi:excisionase family DNA binding protein